MSKNKRLIVRGKQQTKIDPDLLVQVLLAIAREWDEPGQELEGQLAASPDVYEAAIVDREASA